MRGAIALQMGGALRTSMTLKEGPQEMPLALEGVGIGFGWGPPRPLMSHFGGVCRTLHFTHSGLFALDPFGYAKAIGGER